MIITPERATSEFIRRYRERLSAEKMFVDLQHDQDKEELHSVLINMHEDGAGLWTDQALAVGDQVLISIAMQKVFALNLKADVKHVQTISQGLWQVGVEFVKGDASYLEGLEALRRMENLSVEMQLAQFYEDTAVDIVRAGQNESA